MARGEHADEVGGDSVAEPTSAVTAAAVREALAAAYSSEWARLVSTLIRITGEWTLAEDCVQDAFARALADWPHRGIPSNTGAWLTSVAKNRAIDRFRRTATETSSLRELAIMTEIEQIPGDAVGIPDDRLRLIFTCVHPALPMDARVALTLRTVAGLAVPDIARAFLVSEAAMAKRLVRARTKIKEAGIPYRVPPPALLPERTSGVLAVLYLLFNEGYSSGAASLVAEAIRLARLLVLLMPDEREARGLLALMLLQDARRIARTDEAGDIVTLEEQDRAVWDDDEIAEGFATLAKLGYAGDGAGAGDSAAVGGGAAPGDGPADYAPGAGPYELQALIAACHMRASTAASTDFARIARLYDRLARVTPSPVIDLNRAVAIALADGPEVGLDVLDGIRDGGALADYYLLPATRADLLRRLGRAKEAAQQYRIARDLAPSESERRYFDRRLADLGAG